MRSAFVVLGVLLGVLALAKLFAPGSGQADLEMFGVAGFGWVRSVLAVLELAAALALVTLRRKSVVRVVACALGVAVLLHCVDVLHRGAEAHGCGCFGNTGATTAGMDLVRTSLLFSMFAVGAWWSAFSGRSGGIVLSVLAGLFFASFLAPNPHVADDPTAGLKPAAVLADSWQIEPASLSVTGDIRREDLPPPAAPGPARLPKSGHVTVRVEADGLPVSGASVAATALSETGVSLPLASRQTDQLGRVSIAVDEGAYPIAVIVRAQPPWVPVARVIPDVPTEELHVILRRGQPLVVRTVGLDQSALPGVPLVVAPVGRAAKGLPDMVFHDGGWVFEDTRHVTTDSDGQATIESLDPDRVYRAYAEGLGTPTSWGHPDSAAPGDGAELVVQLAPLRVVWVRAVDSESKSHISTVSWALSGSSSEPMRGLEHLWPAKYPWSGFGVLGLSEPVRLGDTIRMYVATVPDDEAIEFGPLVASAPGYEEQALVTRARPLAEARAGPVIMGLHGEVGASFSRVELVPHTSRDSVRALIRVRNGKRVVIAKIWDSESDRKVEFDLAAGDYTLEVGGNELQVLRVGNETVTRRVDLDELPSLRLNLHVGGRDYEGPGYVSMYREVNGSLLWNLMMGDVPYVAGRSPAFVVPQGMVVVSGGSMGGPQAPYVNADMRQSIPSVVELTVP